MSIDKTQHPMLKSLESDVTLSKTTCVTFTLSQDISQLTSAYEPLCFFKSALISFLSGMDIDRPPEKDVKVQAIVGVHTCHALIV